MLLTQNNKITLRSLSKNDLEDFYAYRSDPAVCRYQGFSPYTKAAAESFILKNQELDLMKNGEWMQIAIADRKSNRLLGDAAIRFLGHEFRLAEIGCTISPAAQGSGVATQSMQLLLQTVFTKRVTHKITALMDVRNAAAIRLVEKLGFTREAHFRQSYFDKIDHDWIDEYQYGLLRTEFLNG